MLVGLYGVTEIPNTLLYLSGAIAHNKVPLYFLFNHFLEARAEIREKLYFVFYGELKTLQFPLVIS
jgi:hypothetical protein